MQVFPPLVKPLRPHSGGKGWGGNRGSSSFESIYQRQKIHLSEKVFRPLKNNYPNFFHPLTKIHIACASIMYIVFCTVLTSVKFVA